jgi:predicted membrane-bound dolichyl-phosphate-mannose-protein mannosyltransferase
LFFLTIFLLLGLVVKTLPPYRDEKVYIDCGIAYVSNFTPPMLCNFEHPPFAKYVIGFSHLLGFSRVLFMFFYALSCYLLFLAVYRLFQDFGVSVFVSLLLFFDTLFFNTFRFLLLDPVAIVLSLASLYLAFSAWFRASAALAGLAFASKFSSAPTVLASLYTVFKRRGFGGALKFFAIAFLAYLATYVADFRLGFSTVFEHHVKMFGYMGWRHGFSPALASIGFLKLLTRVEVWRFGGNMYVYVANSSGVLAVHNITTVSGSGLYIVVGIGLGSPAWYFLFPALLHATYTALVERDEALRFVCLWGWLSLLNVVAGPIDWYYANALPALYAVLGLWFRGVFGKRFKVASATLLAVSIAVFFAALLGLAPYRLELYLGSSP